MKVIIQNRKIYSIRNTYGLSKSETITLLESLKRHLEEREIMFVERLVLEPKEAFAPIMYVENYKNKDHYIMFGLDRYQNGLYHLFVAEKDVKINNSL